MSAPIIIRGGFIRDPEISFSKEGNAIARFTVISSRRTKDDSGNWTDVDQTFWDCTAFGKLAENIGESLEKGSQVIISGTVRQEKWQTKDGENRSTFKVRVDDIGPSLKNRKATVEPNEKIPAAVGGFSDEPPF